MGNGTKVALVVLLVLLVVVIAKVLQGTTGQTRKREVAAGGKASSVDASKQDGATGGKPTGVTSTRSRSKTTRIATSRPPAPGRERGSAAWRRPGGKSPSPGPLAKSITGGSRPGGPTGSPSGTVRTIGPEPVTPGRAPGLTRDRAAPSFTPDRVTPTPAHGPGAGEPGGGLRAVSPELPGPAETLEGPGPAKTSPPAEPPSPPGPRADDGMGTPVPTAADSTMGSPTQASRPGPSPPGPSPSREGTAPPEKSRPPTPRTVGPTGVNPTGSAAPAAEAVKRPVRRKIQDGDRLWNIAQEVYGDGTRFPLIVEANPGIDPDRLPVGKEIVIPPAPEQRKTTTMPQAKPMSDQYIYYTIRQEDTFWILAQRYLKDGTKWNRIAEANPGVDPDRLPVGKEIRIPKGPSG